MVNKKNISKEDAMFAVSNGEFSSDVIASANDVVIVMTQDWCPQWKSMNRWIYGLRADKEIDVYELVYNKTDYKDEFMRFKENSLGNSLIPYFRYYKDGKLAADFNYVDQEKFKQILEL
ncbi:MAG: hypothetical protein Q8920_14350 [Bacillota bacterium]|nr:hypothetical protein [Bacillota bacterium]